MRRISVIAAIAAPAFVLAPIAAAAQSTPPAPESAPIDERPYIERLAEEQAARDAEREVGPIERLLRDAVSDARAEGRRRPSQVGPIERMLTQMLRGEEVELEPRPEAAN